MSKETDKLIKRPTEIHGGERSVEPIIPPPYAANYGYGNVEGAVDLRDYLRAIRKYLWLIIAITAPATILVAIYMARQPNIYEAQAGVQVDLETYNPAVGAASKSNSVIVSNPINDPAYFNTQLRILTRPGLLRRVVKTLDLEHNQEFLRSRAVRKQSTWQSLLHMVGLGGKDQGGEKGQVADEVPLAASVATTTSPGDLMEAERLAPFVEDLQEELAVEPVKETRLQNRETRIIDISYQHPNRQIAAKVANAIADTFVLLNLEKKTETNITTADFLQRRITELQIQIRNDEERLINYAKNHQILSLDASQNTVVDRLAGLNKQLMEAENERKMAEAAYHASLVPGAAEAQALSNEQAAKQISESENKLSDLRQQRAQLLIDNTEEWPEVKEVNNRIAVLEKYIQNTRERATKTVTTNLETRYRQSSAREQSLRAAFNQQRGETLTQNEAAVNYRIIQQEIETNKNLLDGLLQRAKENDVAVAGTPNNIHVIDYATAPYKPVGPKRVQAVTLALALSLTFSMGLALLLDYLDDSLRSTDDVEKMLRLPALAVIPAVGGLTRHRLFKTKGALPPRNGTGQPLLMNDDARSPLAEAYRQLRTSILLSTAGRAPKTLLVTSGLPGEGKTTTAVNTALVLAQTGVSVLLIDADMRRPRLHSIFEMKNHRGLSTYLSSDMREAEMLNLVEQHEASSLYVLTSGPVPPNPAELLGSEQMDRLINMFSSTFTHIVIDSPPIASFTDSVLIASVVDGVLLVVHGGKTSRMIALRSRKMLQDVGAKIFGVVLNNVNLRPHDYYYQYYYKYSYYNAASDDDNFTSATLGLDKSGTDASSTRPARHN